MKRVAVVLAVILLLAVVQGTQAADLKAGWYAIIGGVHIYSYMAGSGQIYLRGEANFYDTPSGQYGPFTVTDGPYHSSYERDVSVSTDAYGVGQDQSLILPMTFGMTVGDPIAYLEIGVGTNYDPSQMYLQMWRQHADGVPDELVWEHKQSGRGGFSGNIAYNTVFTGGYYFKVNVVPEPSSLIGMLFGAIPVMSLARRRRR